MDVFAGRHPSTASAEEGGVSSTQPQQLCGRVAGVDEAARSRMHHRRIQPLRKLLRVRRSARVQPHVRRGDRSPAVVQPDDGVPEGAHRHCSHGKGALQLAKGPCQARYGGTDDLMWVHLGAPVRGGANVQRLRSVGSGDGVCAPIEQDGPSGGCAHVQCEDERWSW